MNQEVLSTPLKPGTTHYDLMPKVTMSFGGIENMSDIFSRGLPVFLTPVELGAYSGEQADLFHQWTDLQNQKRDSAKFFKERIERVEDKLLELSNIVREGAIERAIECRWYFDYTHGVKHLVRLDSNTEVETVTLTVEELQGNLFDTGVTSVKNVNDCFKKEEQGEESGTPSVGTGSTEGDSSLSEEPGDSAANLEAVEEAEKSFTEPAFECQDCRKKKKARKCGDDCKVTA